MPKVLTVLDDQSQLRTADAARLNPEDLADWPQLSLLVAAKYLSYLEDFYPEANRASESDRKMPIPNEFWDEFVIDLPKSMGLRVLFSPKVLLTLYRWSLNPSLGSGRWRRFARNIQVGIDGGHKNILTADQRVPQFRRDLIQEIGLLKMELRKKASVSAWNFDVILNILPKMLDEFPGERLHANGMLFTEYVRQNQQEFKLWLTVKRSSDRQFVDEFLRYASRKYKTAELARQAVMRGQKRTMGKRLATMKSRRLLPSAL